MSELQQERAAIRDARRAEEAAVVDAVLPRCGLDAAARQAVGERARGWVQRLREQVAPTLMESFLAEYGLSTQEGVALMCLAEAYLRVPDPETLDALIRDKIGTGRWSEHQRRSRSSLVNASSWALMLTGRMYGGGRNAEAVVADTVRRLVQRVGEPVVRTAVGQAMKVLGQQFVRGRDIEEAMRRGEGMVAKGYTYSFDMLGEAARTAEDARRYFLAYSAAISAIAQSANSRNVHRNHGISIKLSALHPRYEQVQRRRVLRELIPRLSALAQLARNANIGLSVDAEEADRLELSLDVIEAVLSAPDLGGWDGFGVVVQAYSKQAMAVLEWLNVLAAGLGRRIAVRLVKGAYWDMEIKQAQVLGLAGYPVFTRKHSTDVSYLACARYLLDHGERIYPQFATHNAHTAAAILALAGDFDGFEFQRLHGMGEALHEILREESGKRCRIYAPVGVHKDLLAYLVRRLLENGANSSFVHQLLNEEVAAADLVADPVEATGSVQPKAHPRIPLPPDLYAPQRRNSRGWNLNDPSDAAALELAMGEYRRTTWRATPLIAGWQASVAARLVVNPANRDEVVGEATDADAEGASMALETAAAAYPQWRDRPVEERAAVLEAIAGLYEEHAPELMALLTREAGKTRLDGVLEVREAVDFCRYYAQRARARSGTGERVGRGPFVCISPWNFPLAIFTGQISAALVAGNSVVAKPAEQTPLIAHRAVQLMHQAGVPAEVLALVPGDGPSVGAVLVGDPRTAGVCFTGSTETAVLIDRAMAAGALPAAPLIAETGGLNAMIVDSTALPEHAVRDIVASAFQSAGQRCSALRVLFLQDDVAEPLLEMLEGATAELALGDPWDPATDLGPAIDAEAQLLIQTHCSDFAERGRLLFRHSLKGAVESGYFVAPAALRLHALEELQREVFGPVLHVLTFAADQLDAVVDAVNASGYGLTLGVHSRVGDRVDRVCARARVGNIYVNRNQIGAVVGVQPFGGEGLSGTGPKAGGPHYLAQFTRPGQAAEPLPAVAATAGSAAATAMPWSRFAAAAQAARLHWDLAGGRLEVLRAACAQIRKPWAGAAAAVIAAVAELGAAGGELRGPTGERNTLALRGRGLALCLGGGEQPAAALLLQGLAGLAAGNAVGLLAGVDDRAAGELLALLDAAGLPAGLAALVPAASAEALATLEPLDLVLFEGEDQALRSLRLQLAAREGPRVPVVALGDGLQRLAVERVVSVDTTAAGGNTSLLTLAE